jgi:dihydrofolate reductase
MSKLLIRNYSVSLDGFGAGPSQSLEMPTGVGGRLLHNWIFATRGGREMIGMEGGEEGLDNDFFLNRGTNVGATIMGRNMFGPIRGPWDEEWDGWWGDDPPFHHPVFVLTHHPRPPLEMHGGTTFHFVTDGYRAAYDAAVEAAGDLDVLVGGGAETIRQYLRAGLIDDMHFAVVPVLLGSGERPFEDGGPNFDNYTCVEHVCSPSITHVRLNRTDPAAL